MSKLSSLLLFVAASLPFAASAAMIDKNLEPAAMDREAAEQTALEVLNHDTAPATCRGELKPAAHAPTADQITGCCWVFFYGRWWCVEC